MKRVLIYSRVSTFHDQKPEVQIHALTEYCKHRGWIISEVIVDEGYSGGTSNRPGLKKLVRLVSLRKIDLVLVVKLDRLFRSLKHLVETINLFTEKGVEFVSLGDNIDLSTSSGRLMLHIIASFAEFEKDLISERTKAGMLHAKNKGKIIGRPSSPHYEAIRQLRAEGKTYQEIQKALNCSKGVVCRALSQTPKGSTKMLTLGPLNSADYIQDKSRP